METQGDHIHLACYECGKVLEFTTPVFERLRQEIGRETGFDIRIVQSEAEGRCKECRERDGLGKTGVN